MSEYIIVRDAPWLCYIQCIPYQSHTTECYYVGVHDSQRHTMGWLRLVGSFKLLVSFAKEPYTRDDIPQKRPIILRSLLIVATPYGMLYRLHFIVPVTLVLLCHRSSGLFETVLLDTSAVYFGDLIHANAFLNAVATKLERHTQRPEPLQISEPFDIVGNARNVCLNILPPHPPPLRFASLHAVA